MIDQQPIEINHRLIPIKKRTEKVVWFQFSDLCRIPRSHMDYLEIAKRYHTVFISDIPVILPQEKDTIFLFISLVDVFYDAKIRLVISAAEPVTQIYDQGYLVMQYERTASRLLEMQSMNYFSCEADLS